VKRERGRGAKGRDTSELVQEAFTGDITQKQEEETVCLVFRTVFVYFFGYAVIAKTPGCLSSPKTTIKST
jgi:hypothetical protein